MNERYQRDRKSDKGKMLKLLTRAARYTPSGDLHKTSNTRISCIQTFLLVQSASRCHFEILYRPKQMLHFISISAEFLFSFWISFEWSCLFWKKINWNFFKKSFQVNSTRSLRWAHRWWRHHHQQQLGNSSPCLHIDTDLQALICIAHE